MIRPLLQMNATTSNTTVKPVLLLILDGFGYREETQDNAIAAARKPQLDLLMAQCPWTTINASEQYVGLPPGQFGNSEVGHLNIGAGRVLQQDISRIDCDVADGKLGQNPIFSQAIAIAKQNNKVLHILGLVSDGGVHSHESHIHALITDAAAAGVKQIHVHAFLDGRDTPPRSGIAYLEKLQKVCDATAGSARIVSITGRYWAMDRDKRWERVKEAFEMLAHGKAAPVDDAGRAFNEAHAAGESDEFIKPRLVRAPAGAPNFLRDGDGVFCFNFRADRMREIVRTLLPGFTEFERGTLPRLSGLASMTSYEADFPLPVAFPKEALHMGLGEVVSKLGLKQLRLAETEKYAHVTYFFNGGVEDPLPGEDRILVPSPRDVETYDQKPSMSAETVTDRFVEAWSSGQYTLVVCNFANPDMVGHTGVLPAAIAACETVDRCIGRMLEAVGAKGGRMCITADHGNVETMIDAHNAPHTAHTTNFVPFLLVQPDGSVPALHEGRLADIAPTVLALWNIPRPAEMTGRPLTEPAE